MEYRNLGRTGVKVSPLCLGCMNFGRKTELDDSIRIIDRALEAGINFVDTANVYSNGRSEEIVGEALKRSGKRYHVVLATKFHGQMKMSGVEDPNLSGNSRRHIMQQCEASLRRLQTDHIDLYQVHRPQSDIPIDETLRALDDLIRQGKVRYVGTSTYAAWQLVESLWAARELGLNRFVSEQPPYHMLERRIERELVPMARTYGIALLPWSPLAGGFLTGKYKRDQQPPESARLQPSGHRADIFSDAGFDVIEQVEKLAEQKGCTASQFSLAWCMNQPGITSPIIGPRTMEQLEDNLGAIEVELSDDDRRKIDEASRPGGVIATYYEADFGPEPYRW
jgi:aryl-alcohol dehydrogenase-like predicted oxidoreductase